MPRLVHTSGEEVAVSSREAQELLASGEFSLAEGERLAVELESGVQALVDPTTLSGTALTPVAEGQAIEAASAEATFGGQDLRTAVEGAASGVTLGASDLLLRSLTEGDPLARAALQGRAEANPTVRVISEIGGAALPALVSGGTSTGLSAGSVARGLAAASPTGLVARVGANVAKRGAERGLVRRITAGTIAGALEGAAQGAGQGIRQVALSEEPITAELLLATLPKQLLYGAATGGVTSGGLAGVAGLAKKGLDRARQVRGPGSVPIGDDLLRLDRKGLREAKAVEERKLSQQRVEAKALLAEDIAAYRRMTKDAKPWLLTRDKALKAGALIEDKDLGKVALKADKALDRAIDNMKGLRQNPRRAQDALQRAEQALERLQAKAQDIQAQLTATGRGQGQRAQALGRVEELLESNRALQNRLEAAYAPLTSSRLSAIADATDTLASGAQKTIPQQLLEGATFSAVTGAAGPLGPLAPLLGAKAAGAVGTFAVGTLATRTLEAATRLTTAVDGLLGGLGGRPLRTAGMTGARALQTTALGSEARQKPRKLPEAFAQREEEIRDQVEWRQGGGFQMRPGARRALAERLAPLRAQSPLLADRLETAAARVLSYLAEALPKQPDFAGQRLGPRRWRPSSLEMRQFGRRFIAATNPTAAIAGALAGQTTPEAVEAVQAVAPELLEGVRAEIMDRLPNLSHSLPYAKRLSLSMLLGVPLDPLLEPRILAELQASFSQEPGTDGGTHAPTPQPQFGSLSRPEPTKAQERAG